MRRLSGAFRFEARRPLTRPCQQSGMDGQREYTRKTIVETMPYIEVDVPEQQGGEIRTTVRQFEGTSSSAATSNLRTGATISAPWCSLTSPSVLRLVSTIVMSANLHRRPC